MAEARGTVLLFLLTKNPVKTNFLPKRLENVNDCLTSRLVLIQRLILVVMEKRRFLVDSLPSPSSVTPFNIVAWAVRLRNCPLQDDTGF